MKSYKYNDHNRDQHDQIEANQTVNGDEYSTIYDENNGNKTWTLWVIGCIGFVAFMMAYWYINY